MPTPQLAFGSLRLTVSLRCPLCGRGRNEDSSQCDKTIAIDASLIRLVEGEVRRLIGRFAIGLTRVEIYLSDVENTKRGQPDKSAV